MEVVLKPEQVGKILKKISLDGFIYLFYKQNNIEFPSDEVLDLEMSLLKSGYIYVGGKPTKKGTDLIEEVMGVSKKVDNKNKYGELHKLLQDELVKLTGKKQMKANGGHPFLCNEVDLHNKLSKAITKYKLTDWEKVVKCLISHVRKAHKKNFEMVFLIQYYIEKNGMSNLASDYENFVEEVEGTKKTDVFNL